MNTDEINAIVAEKVMGWGREPGHWKVPLWSPATDMNHAMMVWQHMEKNPPGAKPGDWWQNTTLGLSLDGPSIFDGVIQPEPKYTFGWRFIDNWFGEAWIDNLSAKAPSAPLAICLAALKTVGVEPPAC